jgi:RNA polymerase sigma factor (sigma-70 family)
VSIGKASRSGQREADFAAVDALSREYRPALVRYFERRGVPAMDAEDVAQDVFDRLARREGVSGIEKLERYLFETAANAAVDYHRRAKSRGRKGQVVFDESLHAPQGGSPEAAYLAQQELAQVLVALRELPERTRHIFVLARLENIKQVEIARGMGLSISAVEKHMRLAMAHLFKRLEQAQ